jgi:hypothetical protein
VALCIVLHHHHSTYFNCIVLELKLLKCFLYFLIGDEKKTTSLAIVLTLAFGVILASTAVSVGPTVVVFAQKNHTKASSSSNSNQTTVTPAGKESTKIINQTTIPANQTSTTIEKTAKPVEKTPLSVNQTKNLSSSSSSRAKLPPVSNKTTVTPAGKATTTVINQTTTPVNV